MGKVLFVCHGNVGRSQMAEGFYNAMTQTKNASSAGTDPLTPLKYPKLPETVCRIMQEEGIDVSEQIVKLITEKMVDAAESIVILCKREYCPDFLLNSQKVIFWNIEDPYRMNIDDMRVIRDKIKMKVAALRTRDS
jgi:protein-tyrosine-phosphatase